MRKVETGVEEPDLLLAARIQYCVLLAAALHTSSPGLLGHRF